MEFAQAFNDERDGHCAQSMSEMSTSLEGAQRTVLRVVDESMIEVA
jgi:hypothetical protein